MIILGFLGFILLNNFDFFICFLKFQKLMENQFDRKIKVFQCAGESECISIIFFAYTAEQNCVAKRKHCHIVETTLTIMFSTSILLQIWTEIFLAVVYLINRMPLSTLNMKSLYETLLHKTLNFNGIKIFGV